MTTYEDFKKALFKADKKLEAEIKALKFGCKFLWQEDCRNEWLSVFENWINKNESIRALGILGQQLSIDYHRITEIIGRDITLEDVLRALSEIDKNDFGIKCYLGKTTNLAIQVGTSDYIWWQPGKPAHLQSEETLLALIRLIECR